jgi:hypothetical protein
MKDESYQPAKGGLGDSSLGELHRQLFYFNFSKIKT